MEPVRMKSAGVTGGSDPGISTRMVVPVQMIPGLISALQENFRLYQESFGPPKGPMH